MGPYMRYPAAADYLGITEPALHKAVELGEIPFIKWGSRVLFAKDDLDYFMAARRVEVTT